LTSLKAITSNCRHFGLCGGCAVDDRTAIDKSAYLRAALARAGYPNPLIAPLIQIPLHTRRRADLGVTRTGTTIALGLHKTRSPEVVDMQECILLAPSILQLLPPLRTLLRSLKALRRTGAVHINLLDQGPDILLRLDADFSPPDRARLIEFARAHNAVRLSIATATQPPEPMVILQPPRITFSGVPVEPPPGAFLQASREGESAIIAATLAALPKLTKKSHVIELFAGCGTISFALATHARVAAYEGDPSAAAALDKAIRAANLSPRLTMSQRDLHRRPLQPAEFATAAAVILDPPYAGAPTQTKFLAASKTPRIIYISCNPDALAQDARTLHQAGYTLLNATPIDQFPYSENLETVAVFDL
jgi:23S rRNA (uracil1939-C5)-methyltransferase